MVRAVVIPIGVTKETVEGVLRDLPKPDIMIVVTVPGYDDVKRPIIEALRATALTLGAKFYTVIITPSETKELVDVYRILVSEKPGEVYLIGITGTRYLLPTLTTVLLRYWRSRNARVYLVHGVEGGEYSVEPLPGFYAVAMRISSLQRRLLEIIYGAEEPVSGKELMEKYGFTKSVYHVLADLERKGLLVVRRGRIEKTFPGRLVHELLKAGGGSDEGAG